jgi:hypothetical protein
VLAADIISIFVVAVYTAVILHFRHYWISHGLSFFCWPPDGVWSSERLGDSLSDNDLALAQQGLGRSVVQRVFETDVVSNWHLH